MLPSPLSSDYARGHRLSLAFGSLAEVMQVLAEVMLAYTYNMLVSYIIYSCHLPA